MIVRLVALLLLGHLNVEVSATGMQVTRVNPVRKVVRLLGQLQRRAEAQGKVKEDNMGEYKCYCASTIGKLRAAIFNARNMIPTLRSSIEEGTALKDQLQGELDKANRELNYASRALATAKSIRVKQRVAFTAESDNLKANIQALQNAVPAIQAGVKTKGVSAFLQTESANRLRQLSLTLDMIPVERDKLTSFLAGGTFDDTEYEPQSNEILGILKQMQEDMQKRLDFITPVENEAERDYNLLRDAKKKEIDALQEQVETQTARVGELSIEMVNQKNQLEDYTEGLKTDEKFLMELKTDCVVKTKEFDEWKIEHREELVALAETMEILNKGAAAFTQIDNGGTSFMQIQVSSTSLKRRARKILKKHHRKGEHADPRVDLIELALSGKDVGFLDICNKIDELMRVLTDEQTMDDERYDYCAKEMKKTLANEVRVKTELSTLQKAVDEGKENMAALTADIKSLNKGISDLDSAVREAEANRRKEKSDFKRDVADQSSAKDLLRLARKRLAKFYQPMNEETEFVQVKMHHRMHRRHHRTEEQEANEDDQRKEDAGHIFRAFDALINDIDMNIKLSQQDEQTAQKDYEQLLVDSEEKRAKDSQSVMDKEEEKVELETSLQKQSKMLERTKAEGENVQEYLNGIRKDCDWHLKYYEVRKNARGDEMDGLEKAKAVLSGSEDDV